MAATQHPSEIKIILMDVNGGQAEYYLFVPVSTADTAAALTHNHTDELRPDVSHAQIKRAVVALRHIFEDGSETPVANGRLVSQRVQFDAAPGGANRPVRLQIPAVKLSLLSTNTFTGKQTRCKQEGVVANLVESWLTGISGIRPVNTRGQAFTSVSDGLLITEEDS